MKTSKFIVCAASIASVALAGCCCFKCASGAKTDAEGFTYMDGRRVATSAPSDYYIIRYEKPSAAME